MRLERTQEILDRFRDLYDLEGDIEGIPSEQPEMVKHRLLNALMDDATSKI